MVLNAMESFPPPPRSRLDAPAELFDGWSADDDQSYARTPDARVSLAAHRGGLRDPATDDDARSRALHDVSMSRALGRQLGGTLPVAVMGGHKMRRGEDDYRVVAETARLLCEQRFLVVTGGGPGAMEAAHVGARFAGSGPGEMDAGLAALSSDEAARASPLGPDELVGDGGYSPSALRRLHRWQVPAFRLAAGAPLGAA